MKNLFAADLDRTLIYSKRAIAEFNEDKHAFLTPVEYKDGQVMAYMTNKSIEALHHLAKEALFVPVTTRTPEQFNRINLRVPLKYAITTNGANIFYKGDILKEWQETVINRMKKESASIQEIKLAVQPLTINGRQKDADDLFFYYLLDERLAEHQLEEASSMANNIGWRTSLQGRKLYFIPYSVSKGEAVNFIKERENIDISFGAGDSLLDHDFLKACDFSFVPSHGELANHPHLNKAYQLTNEKGFKATEEMLGRIEQLIAFQSQQSVHEAK
ncbi:hydroxymethylpyrimidine pyrophosphatase-like HAD family hydrolase [Cytobacillus horneckiae]|uniref:HAD family hydrolase n=1 Tax=Cytobacillus horneckiae TaxID=549687 RepID=UPI0019D13B87|nr:HAD family hydrolase [Cytobacillus horneckiae]MBN6888558.1 hypothetical protein [Cytobacillus horneckiae]MCM3180353.1 hypothetical protein [Cytobacillus horneckiae]